jgi:hypothetical protein
MSGFPDRAGTRCLCASSAGFSALELLLSVSLMSLAIAATSGMFVAGKGQMVMKGREVETTQAARAALDVMVRDLRLGGACLPVTGEFISLDGTDNGNEDEIITRTGLTRADLSCIRSATMDTLPAGDVLLEIESTEGFEPGTRAYLRHPNGSGEFIDIAAVPSSTQLTLAGALDTDYPPTSGVYAIDERRFYINWFESAGGQMIPELMVQIGSETPISFAAGIEELAVRYQLSANCDPECDVVDLPSDNAQWQLVEQVLIDLTARSALSDKDGVYFRRTLRVAVKPRNILPR